MKKFNFPMQKVLEYKEHIENREKNLLMQMRLAHKNLCKERDALKNESDLLKTEYQKMCSKGIQISEMVIVRSYLAELEKKMEEVVLKIRKEEHEIDRQVNKIVEVSKGKNTIEKLKEKYYLTYQRQKRKEAELFIDEYAANGKHFSIND